MSGKEPVEESGCGEGQLGEHGPSLRSRERKKNVLMVIILIKIPLGLGSPHGIYKGVAFPAGAAKIVSII